MPQTVFLDYRGAPQTVAFIKRGALDAQTKPIVRYYVEAITRDLPSKDVISECLACYHFVLDKTRYLRDPRTLELVRAPWIILEQIQQGHTPGVDCDDVSSLLCAMALASGAECRVVTVAFQHMQYRGERQYSHVFAQVKEPRTSKWITLDPVAGDRVAEMQKRVVAAKIWPIA